MVRWHEKKSMALALRAGGLALGGFAWWISTLLGDAIHRHPLAGVTPLQLLAGMLCFLCASAGLAFALLGSHMFDPVTLSERWISVAAQREGR